MQLIIDLFFDVDMEVAELWSCGVVHRSFTNFRSCERKGTGMTTYAVNIPASFLHLTDGQMHVHADSVYRSLLKNYLFRRHKAGILHKLMKQPWGLGMQPFKQATINFRRRWQCQYSNNGLTLGTTSRTGVTSVDVCHFSNR